jgi:hypothetical protein
MQLEILMSEFDSEGDNGKFTLQDFVRLFKLNLWCKPEDKLERDRLRRKGLKWMFNPLLTKWIWNPIVSVIGWFIAVLLVISGLIPPYVSLQFVLMAIGFVGVLFLLPRVSGLYSNWLNGWGLLAVKAFIVLTMGIASSFYPMVSQMKKDVNFENERQKVNAMNPDERYRYEEGKRRETQLNEAKEAREKVEQAAKKWDAEQVVRDREASLKRQASVRENNKEQRDFYSDLGSPKILYKCNNSDAEKAVGAKVGNINLLLSNAQQECGFGGYEILKRKE